MSRFPLKETVFAVKTLIFFAALRAGGFICAQTQTQILAGGFYFCPRSQRKNPGGFKKGGGLILTPRYSTDSTKWDFNKMGLPERSRPTLFHI